MAEENKEVEEKRPFDFMDFEEPTLAEIMGEEEVDEEEECEDCEDDDEYEYYDPDSPQPESSEEEELEYKEDPLPVQEGLQADLVAAAKLQGLTEEEIAAIGDPKALNTIISALHRRAIDTVAEDQASRESDATLNQVEESRKLLADIENMDPDEQFDPASAKAIKALSAELHRMRIELAAVGSKAENVEYEQSMSEISAKFPEVLGKGKTNELEPSSEHLENRARLLEEVEVLRAGYKASRKQVPVDSALFEKAFRSVFGTKIYEIERERFKKKVNKREKQFIARATNNRVSTKQGREKAVSNVAALMRDRGLLELDAETFS